ncbi:MAG TPA: hypothetical protein VHH72_09540 [Solirubrobacterales bacterium]|nr:hypothetical protein [Solirubrobacterales bacterium]
MDGPVAVYVSLPLTGPRGADGNDAADGARLALEQAGSRAGGLDVVAKYLDDAAPIGESGPPAAIRQWDPVATAANARAAAQDSTTAAYIGELDNEPTRTSLPITNDAGILQISPGAGGIDLTAPAEGYPDSPGRYRPSGEASFARVVPDDGTEATAAADLAIELGYRKVDVAARDLRFDELIASEFASAAEGVGVEIGHEGANAALTIGQTDGISLLPGGRRADGPGDEVHSIAQPLAPENLPGAEFPARFEQRFDRRPGPYAAYGYEAMNLALQGIAAADDSDEEFRAAVVDGVLDSERPDSILGPYSITEDGDTTLCAVQPYSFGGPRSIPGEPICPGG